MQKTWVSFQKQMKKFLECFTFSCDELQADSCGIGSFGMTRKCVGACLFTSWNATH